MRIAHTRTYIGRRRVMSASLRESYADHIAALRAIPDIAPLLPPTASSPRYSAPQHARTISPAVSAPRGSSPAPPARSHNVSSASLHSDFSPAPPRAHSSSRTRSASASHNSRPTAEPARHAPKNDCPSVVRFVLSLIETNGSSTHRPFPPHLLQIANLVHMLIAAHRSASAPLALTCMRALIRVVPAVLSAAAHSDAGAHVAPATRWIADALTMAPPPSTSSGDEWSDLSVCDADEHPTDAVNSTQTLKFNAANSTLTPFSWQFDVAALVERALTDGVKAHAWANEHLGACFVHFSCNFYHA